MRLRISKSRVVHTCEDAGVLALIAFLWSAPAQADTIVNVRYSAQGDQLVVTMGYRGTNPGHVFSLNWGRCQNSPEHRGHQVDAEILDSQSQDAEKRDFTKTTRFALKDMPCRPARLTLRSAPRFLYTVDIPVNSAGTR